VAKELSLSSLWWGIGVVSNVPGMCVTSANAVLKVLLTGYQDFSWWRWCCPGEA
jgi:hypothetical protein